VSIASKVKSQLPKLRKLAPKLLLARAIVCCRARRESPLHEWHLLALWHSSAESLFVPFPSAVPYRCRLSHLSLPSLTDSLSDILWPKSETHRVLRSRNLGLATHQLGLAVVSHKPCARCTICLTKARIAPFRHFR